MARFPHFSSYVNYSSDNYGAHALRFDTDDATFWFSYKTLVAFRKTGNERVVHENDWGTTSGKHLNAIDDGDKKSRVDDVEFKRLYAAQFGEAL
jgi:hypothetical protein